jgi:hypothetical protein
MWCYPESQAGGWLEYVTDMREQSSIARSAITISTDLLVDTFG